MQAGESADKCILISNSKLTGKDAVVNKGSVQISKLPFGQPYRHKTTHDRGHNNASVRVQAEHAYDSDFDD